jgi:hypothetical protein
MKKSAILGLTFTLRFEGNLICLLGAACRSSRVESALNPGFSAEPLGRRRRLEPPVPFLAERRIAKRMREWKFTGGRGWDSALNKKAIFEAVSFGDPARMGMRGLRCLFGACGVGIFIVAAAQIALAGSGPALSSNASKKPNTSSAAHHGASAKTHRHATRPGAHQATAHKDHKKETASRPTPSSSAGPANKSIDQRSLLGPFSLGVETEHYVKRRSIRGGDYDPDIDGEPRGYRPPYLGFSLKAPLSW